MARPASRAGAGSGAEGFEAGDGCGPDRFAAHGVRLKRVLAGVTGADGRSWRVAVKTAFPSRSVQGRMYGFLRSVAGPVSSFGFDPVVHGGVVDDEHSAWIEPFLLGARFVSRVVTRLFVHLSAQSVKSYGR